LFDSPEGALDKGFRGAPYGTHVDVSAQTPANLTPALMNDHSGDNAYVSGGAGQAAVLDFTGAYTQL
jgi:hypothetical protein